MRILPRRLLMWGGAAAVASAGFAFMASNSVAVSGAGEGNSPVAGYNVTNISYNGGSGYNCGGQLGCYLNTATFTLTSQDTTTTDQAYTTAPKFVYADVTDSTGHLLANADGCSLQGNWTSGSGEYLCQFNPTTAPLDQIDNFDVAASQ